VKEIHNEWSENSNLEGWFYLEGVGRASVQLGMQFWGGPELVASINIIVYLPLPSTSVILEAIIQELQQSHI
jgi:hypothetical protein